VQELSSNPENSAMSRPSFFALPALACSTLLFTGALNRQASPSAPPPPPAGVDPLDPAGVPGGTDLLDAAIATFAPERIPWMQMTLWQRVQCEDVTYEAQGRYLAGPNRLLRLEMKVRVGQAQGELQMIRNGGAARCTYRIGSESPATIKAVHRQGTGPAPTAPQPPVPGSLGPQERDEILEESEIPGVATLLRNLRAGLQEPRQKRSRWKGHDVILVMGKWQPNPALAAGIGANLLPKLQPRECRAYLDARTLWPLRIEWWGSPSPQKRNVLLMQVEHREPILNQPLSPERCAREFDVTPPNQGLVGLKK
jgi:hypothetical protein